MKYFYTIACSLKVANQKALYVGRYTGTQLNGREQDAQQFATRSHAASVAQGLSQTRHDMVFSVCDIIANSLEDYTVS